MGDGLGIAARTQSCPPLFLEEEVLTAPLRWRRPRRVFVCSMTDLFAGFVPDEWIAAMFGVMALAGHHVYQVLTKRPERMLDWVRQLDAQPDRLGYLLDALLKAAPEAGEYCLTGWEGRKPQSQGVGSLYEWIWLGVSIESREHLDRLDLLRETPAAVRFVSFEPILEDLGDVDLRGIDQAIYGGESGPQARPCDLAWIRRGVACCRKSGTAAFVKQLGRRPFTDSDMGMYGWPPQVTFIPVNDGALAEVHLRDRAGGTMSEWPEDLRVREMPNGAR